MARYDESINDASDDQGPHDRVPDIRIPAADIRRQSQRSRRSLLIVKFVLPILCFAGFAAAMVTIVWFANQSVDPPVPQAPVVRVALPEERIVQPKPQVPKFAALFKEGAKEPWVAIADPQAGPAVEPPGAGDRPLAPLAKFLANPLKVIQPESQIVLALDERHDRNFGVLDLTTGQTLSRVKDDQVVCFDADGKRLVRARPNRFEICSIADDKVLARVSQGRVGGAVTGELAGPNMLLLRIELGWFERRHVVWDWTKDRLLFDRRVPDRQHGFGGSALSPGGRYLVLIRHPDEGDDSLGPDELTAIDLMTGIVAGRSAIKPPDPHEVGADGKPQGQSWAAIAFSRDGRRLGAVRSDRVLHVWDWTTGMLLRETPLDAERLFLRAQNRTPMALVDEDQPVLVAGRLYSPVNGTEIALPELRPGDDIVSYLASGRVAAIVKDPEVEREGGPPPHWSARVVAFDPAK